MFGALLKLAPTTVFMLGLAVGGFTAAPAAWFAHGLKFSLFDRPAIEREATARADAACAIRVTAAAERAEQAERARQQAASAQALRTYQNDLVASQRRAAEALLRLDLEIADHEADLIAQGRSCPATQSDLDFVYQRRPAAADSRR